MNDVLSTLPHMHQAIGSQNVPESVARTLASMIASGIIRVGDRLPGERELAQALRVSRVSVRGAIQMLGDDGLLSISQGARTVVISDNIAPHYHVSREPGLINSYSLEDIHATRKLVEHHVVAEAARRIDQGTLTRLRDSLTLQRKALNDPMQFLIADREFHLAIYTACESRVQSDLVFDLYGYMMNYRRIAVAEPGATTRSIADHEIILEALERHDPVQVAAAFDVHLERIYQTTQEVLLRDRDQPSNSATGD